MSLNTPFTHGKCCLLLPQPLCKAQWKSLALLPLALQQAPPLFFHSSKISFLCSHRGYSWNFILPSQQETAQTGRWAEGRICLPGKQQDAWSCPHPVPWSTGKGGCKKGLKCGWGRFTFMPLLYILITSMPKNEYRFPEPRKSAIGSSFGAQKDLTKTTP